MSDIFGDAASSKPVKHNILAIISCVWSSWIFTTYYNSTTNYISKKSVNWKWNEMMQLILYCLNGKKFAKIWDHLIKLWLTDVSYLSSVWFDWRMLFTWIFRFIFIPWCRLHLLKICVERCSLILSTLG